MANGKQQQQQQQQQQKGVPIDSLPTERLDMLGKQLDREVGKLSQSAQVLGSLASEYQSSNTAVQELKDLEDGQQMMVPLTESLYVSGQVYEKDKVLLELGAGYYAEVRPTATACDINFLATLASCECPCSATHKVCKGVQRSDVRCAAAAEAYCNALCQSTGTECTCMNVQGALYDLLAAVRRRPCWAANLLSHCAAIRILDMQRSPDEAADFCQRKVAHVKKQLDEIGNEINSKSNAIRQINDVMARRQRESEAVGQQKDGV